LTLNGIDRSSYESPFFSYFLFTYFRIHKYSSCSNECFILALIYIDRLIQRNNFLLTELNVHRVVITAILLAAKFFDDAYYNNAYYSKVGGVLVSEMNGLEVDFLFRINFSLHVTPDVFDKYRAELVSHSLSAGLTMPPQQQQQQQLQTLDMQSSSHAGMAPSVAASQQGQTTSVPMTLPTQPLHHPPPQVTPSPHHAAVPLSATYADQRNESSNNCHPMYVSDQLFPNGVTQQQFLQIQRANSMPAQFSGHPGRCAHNPPYSAPMVSMLPGGVEHDQFLVLDNQLFPLQTTMVHHHHGVESYHDPNSYHQPEQVNGGYPIGRVDPVSSLVGGLY
jgi:hypothetical protein